VPSPEFAQRCYDIAKFGEIPEELLVDCVVASNLDSSLAPAGKHIMTALVQYVPYKLKRGTWATTLVTIIFSVIPGADEQHKFLAVAKIIGLTFALLGVVVVAFLFGKTHKQKAA
jgi:phytoene dehydrogenase-like protein